MHAFHACRPVKALKLYEFQGCPFCAKVREAVTVLDLDVTFLPCPKGGSGRQADHTDRQRQQGRQ